ncbi:MAG: GNAT family N-acetyltransferase [Thermoleophilia bacterium]
MQDAGRAVRLLLGTRRVTVVELIDETSLPEDVAGGWDDLSLACGRPCATPHLLLPWLRHMAPEAATPRIVVVREGPRIVGVAPFYSVPGPLGVHTLRLLGTPSLPQRGTILARPGREPEVTAAAARALGARWRTGEIRLERIDASAVWPREFAAAWPAYGRARVIESMRVTGPVLSTEAPSFDAWLASRTPHFRHDIRRTARRMEQAGARIWLAEDPGDRELVLVEFARLHGERWGDRSSLWRPPAIAMLQDAARVLDPRRMRLYAVSARGGIAAAAIHFAAGGEVVAWNAGWDPAYSDLRPATAIAYRVVQDAFAFGDRRIDWGEGRTLVKERLSDWDEPVAWVSVLPRNAAYPLIRLFTSPPRLRHRAWTAAQRLPPNTRRRIRSLRSRGRRLRGRS